MRALIGVVAAAAIAVAGCTASTPTNLPSVNANAVPADVQVINPKSAFTAKTLSDWKSLGDAIVIAQVTSAREQTSGESNPEDNGGVYGRIVTVAVLNTMWTRDAAHVPPSTFDMNAWGWVLRGNAKRAIVPRGEPRLETNHVYLLVLAKFSTGWSTLGDGAEVPFDDGAVGTGEWAGKDPSDDQPAIDDLLGKDLNQAQAVIDAASPDPRSLAYNDLDPLERAKKLGKTS